MVNQKKGFFEAISNEAIMGILSFDPLTKQCLYINRLARETLELTMPDLDGPGEAETIPLEIHELFPDVGHPGFSRAFCEEMLRHEGLSQDVLVRKKNGYLFIANVGIKHIVADGQDQLLVMFQDVSVQKKLQREVQLKQDEIHKAFSELLEQNRQLRELDHAKDKFIALTTHELRTPLSAIVATAEVLDLGFYESEEQKTEFIRTIHEQALQLMELVNDVLDFAKIRAGKMEYFIEETELLPSVQKIVDNFEHMAQASEVSMRVEVPATPIKAFVDVLRLKEVLNNVINNAIKYNRPKGTVTVRIEEHRGMARIKVIDTGQGIPADKLASVFNEFETVGSVSRHHKGTGLGMPISKRLMQGMGGDLTLESEAGVGSTFHLDIPTTKVLSEDHYRTRPDAWADLAA